jgi:hypothetical protein
MEAGCSVGANKVKKQLYLCLVVWLKTFFKNLVNVWRGVSINGASHTERLDIQPMEEVMSNDSKNPKPGALRIDASSLEGVLLDLPEGGLRGLAREKDGCEQVIEELNANHKAYGGNAGITDADLIAINELHEKIKEIALYLPAAEKLLELLIESRAYYEDKRERQIKLLVSSIEARGQQSGNTELSARYQKTREYYSRTAKKAAQTRQKNKAQKSEPTT